MVTTLSFIMHPLPVQAGDAFAVYSMKNIYFISILILFSSSYVCAQKHDNIWVHIAPWEDTIGPPIDPPFPAAIQRFNTSPPEIIYYPAPYPEAAANITMCDEGGTPLFYTNGYDIYYFSGKMMVNGDSLAPKAFQKDYILGYAAEMAMMCVPRPGRDGDYYLLLLYKEPNWTYTPKIMLALITGATEPDSGKVEFKNKVIFEGHNRIDFFNITKHANGLDWWVVFSDFDTDNRIRTFHSIYLGQDTAYVANSQIINGYEPAPEHPWQVYTAQRVFSPNGEYFIGLDLVYGVRIHRFDRCTGVLGPLTTLPYEEIGGRGGAGISPNSRFLYVSNTKYILQYDLQASDIVSSVDTVGIYDGYQIQPWGHPVVFDLCHLGPDGKIYYLSYKWEQLIAKPNKKGQECRFIQRAIELPVIAPTCPYYPNYRLGPIDGSGCDTLGLNNEPLADFWWFADSTLTVEFVDNSSYEPAGWHWTFGDGGMSADTNPVHTFPAPGLYTVCLRVSNQYAADTVCKQVRVGGTTGAWAPAQAQAALRVVPNPASDRILVQLPGPDGGRLEIFDVTGRLQTAMRVPGQTQGFEVSVENLPPGMYFARINDGNTSRAPAKFLIQH